MDRTGLPPDVRAALQRGDRLDAMRLLRDHLETDSKGMPEVSAALERGDSADAVRLLRESVERAIGPPLAEAGQFRAEPASLSDSLQPGQVPRSSWAGRLGWAVVVVLAIVGTWMLKR